MFCLVVRSVLDAIQLSIYDQPSFFTGEWNNRNLWVWAMSNVLPLRAAAKWILRNTISSRHHLTPEMSLSLITEQCPLWMATPDQCPLPDPYWAFYWPGGQALTRQVHRFYYSPDCSQFTVVNSGRIYNKLTLFYDLKLVIRMHDWLIFHMF